ncbi:YbaK/EbsC family protein [Streptomyces noursei]|uniref:YbaK/EbsC family protein n=1 Tax=Streptomyces noursei TaxID=1971 RepID=UPI000830D7AE|nr:YbaK/EbsC family protein [Streptomyces noursei]
MINSPTTPFGRFEAAWRAVDRPELVADPTAAALRTWAGAEPVESVLVVDTDPEKADTSVFCDSYDVPLELSANCVIVSAKRGENVTFAACVALATTRVDVNRTVRKHLGARKASFAPMETAVAETGMEYGGISPLGLPADWPVLIDEAVAAIPHVLIGSGRRRGKIILSGRFLTQLPGAEVLPQLAT